MDYLGQPRVRAILAGFVATSLLLVTFPQIDLYVSGLFYRGGFPFLDTVPQRLIRALTTIFLCISIIGVATIFLLNRASGRTLGGIDGRRVCYLLVVLAVGAGAIVNLALKDNFGRARPIQITEFGGSDAFTPAFAVSGECRKNCSFSSGEAAAGFFSITLVYALARRRRAAWIAALSFGAVVSVARIAAGAHFLSDTLVSFFIMWLLSDALHHAMRLAPATPEPAPAPAGAAAIRRAPTG